MSESLHTLQRVPSPLARDLGALMLTRAVCSCGNPATSITINAATVPPKGRAASPRRVRVVPLAVADLFVRCGEYSERCDRATLPDAATAYADEDYGE